MKWNLRSEICFNFNSRGSYDREFIIAKHKIYQATVRKSINFVCDKHRLLIYKSNFIHIMQRLLCQVIACIDKVVFVHTCHSNSTVSVYPFCQLNMFLIICGIILRISICSYNYEPPDMAYPSTSVQTTTLSSDLYRRFIARPILFLFRTELRTFVENFY